MMDNEEEPPPWWFGPALFGGMVGAVALMLAAMVATE
jgi:hypothetical protein